MPTDALGMSWRAIEPFSELGLHQAFKGYLTNGSRSVCSELEKKQVLFIPVARHIEVMFDNV